jgi:hypothetical protein
VVFGIKMVHFILSLLQEKATHCAWFQAEAATTHFCLSVSDNDEIKLYAHLIL